LFGSHLSALFHFCKYGAKNSLSAEMPLEYQVGAIGILLPINLKVGFDACALRGALC